MGPVAMNSQGLPPAPRSAVGKVRVLTYHRIGPPRGVMGYERLTVPPARFARQVRTMRRIGFQFIGLDDVSAWLRGELSLPKRPAVLTFDDGFADLREYVLPLVRQAGLTPVVFLVTDRREDAWREEGHEPLRLLSWPEAREMAEAGVVFGSHTRTHVRLTECSDRRLREEVAGSKKRIEDELGREVRHFCYPYGAHDDRVVEAVAEAGYLTACTTLRGAVRPGADPLRLPRLTVGKRMGMARFVLRITVRS